jgi:hypothetical protein
MEVVAVKENNSMGSCFYPFCAEHTSTQTKLGVLKTKMENIEKDQEKIMSALEGIKKDMKGLLNDKHSITVVWVISFLTGALGITTTLILSHLLQT